MKFYTANEIRNIGIFGHGGEGKTTLTEAMLYNAGLVDRFPNNTPTTDFDPEEIKRSISINMALAPLEWKGTKINLIDAPGFFDFYGEVTAALELADAALIVVGAVSGPVVGAEKAMAMCKDLTEAKEKFGTSIVPIQLPILEGGVFKGYVDILNMTAKLFDGKGEKEAPIPGNLQAEAESLLEQLTEAAAAADDDLMMEYLETMELTHEQILQGLSKGALDGDITPVCCTAAVANLGVIQLLDNIVHYLPSAAQSKLPKAFKDGKEIELTRDGKMVCSIYKTVNDQFGKYSIVKVHRGTLDASVTPYNVTAEKSEKPTAPTMMRGKKSIPVDKLNAGDIGAIPKLQFSNTNDTLCDPADVVEVEKIKFPEPCIGLAVTAKKQGEEDKVISGLNKLLEEDPSIALERNAETGDVLLKGLGEMHLDVTCAKLKNKNNVEAQLADPRIPYRETIRTMAEAEGKHKKQTGGSGQFGVVQMRFEPADEGVDFEFVNAIVGGVVPKEYIPAVEKGLREAMVHGVLAGYPMVGIKATLYDGKYHPVDSKEVAFKSAARLSYKAACIKANPVLTEPIYTYYIWVPNDNVGDIMGDLSRRRGRMLGMTPTNGGTEIVAEAPLSEMFKYATDLRSMTQARGSFRSEFTRYEDVPGDQAKKIIEQAKREDEDEE